MIKLYNTLTKEVEQVSPLECNSIKVYSCGPTVYDHQHIGNWFTYIRYDLLIRTLKLNGLNPTWVINITDVGHLTSDADSGEDKLVTGAEREKKTAWEVANFYTQAFLSGLKKLNIFEPNHIPKASDHISEQVEFIKGLETKGLTYAIDDGVYFDSSKFPEYSKLARLNIQEQEAGKRVSYNPQKHNISDFALWKLSPIDQKRDMEWDSPWGKGFPGWHIECSAMILKYLGPTVDIHCGGIDHIPVHHTNEIAQSESLTGKKLANIWMHTNHILLDEAKISKSLGNGITLDDITEKGYELEALRLLCLESHYRTQSKFGWSQLDAAANRLRDYRAAAALKWQPVSGAGGDNALFDEFRANILSYLNNDLNTPLVLAMIGQFADQVRSKHISSEQVAKFNEVLDLIDQALGLTLSKHPDISEDQKDLIEQRDIARSHNDWTLADKIRADLDGQGIELNDTELQTQWSRK